MAEIKTIRIENFQSHENTLLDFHSGLNVIVGPSDQGKSAIIRAIKWVLYNEPRGIDFIRQGTSVARVTMEMSNGYTILRERSKSKNKYSVTTPSGETSTFEGFGNDLPEEVIKAHGIPRVQIDADLKSCLNIAEQLEGPFLLAETGSMKAKALGRLSGVHIIDQAIRDCLVDLKRENQTAERVKFELSDFEDKLKSYEQLEVIGQTINIAETIVKELGGKREKYFRLEKAKDNLIAFEKEHTQVWDTVERLKFTVESEKYIKSCELSLVKYKQLMLYPKKLNECEVGSTESNEIMLKTQATADCESVFHRIETLKSRLGKLEKFNKEYSGLRNELVKIEKTMNSTKEYENSVKLIKKANVTAERLNKMTKFHDEILGIEKELEGMENVLAKSQQFFDYNNEINSIESKNTRIEILKELKLQFEINQKSLCEGNVFLAENKINIQELSQAFAKTLKKAGKCPVCASEINESKIEDILKYY